MKPFNRQLVPGPRACGYFKAASRNACRRQGGSAAQSRWLYALELDTFRLWTIDRPNLKQEAEVALEAGARLKAWKQKLTHCVPSGLMLERGLMTWKVLSERPEVAVPRAILRGIVNQCIERAFGGDTPRCALADQLGDGDLHVVDRRHQTHLEGLTADFEEAMASVDKLDAAIFHLHVKGHSFRELGDMLGISSSHAQRRYEDIRSILSSRLRDYRLPEK
jgi:hypothetical protein